MSPNRTTERKPPQSWPRITTLDVHTAGEPLRIIVDGFPALPGATILEKRRNAKAGYDDLRTALMWEPRGHADMYGAILTEPVTDDGHLGVLFMHNEGFSTMCGHGIIGLAMAGVEGGAVTLPEDGGPLRMDTPAGRVTAFPDTDQNGKVTGVSFENVPSYAAGLNREVDVPGVGRVLFDLAFGGAYYALCRASDFGLSLDPSEFSTLIDLGMRIKQTVMATTPIEHPHEPDLGFLYGTIFVGEAHDPANHSRNVCVFAEGEVDRCPTGTGVSARAAVHYARGEIGVGEPFVVESILGTTFTGEVVEPTEFGGLDAVIPRVSGTSYITGQNQLLLDPDDPLRNGFILR